MSCHGFDEPFDKTMSTFSLVVPATAPVLQKIDTQSPALDELINHRLTKFLEKLLAYERKSAQVHRVDGLIIGTGEADFTKGNTHYPLNYKGKRFQLIDVPGIEGDESKYAHMVREAVAKAHLVFYVNGTNKKPEKTTAQKIRTYLRLGTQVCPLINVRGNADAYEFEEDRESLANHGGATTALRQTEEVLRSVLGNKVMLPGHCVQGLLAFSSLASDTQTGRTTIDSSRDYDLVIQQRNYQRRFASSKEMYEFSQIASVANVLHSKLVTFREDMVESNKAKVREMLVENGAMLQALYATHESFIARTQPELEKCREAIKAGQERFERLVITGRKNLLDELFNLLKGDADAILEQHFGDNDTIANKINYAFKTRQDALANELQAQLKKHTTSLHEDLQEAMQRLLEDIARVEFEQIVCDTGTLSIHYTPPELDFGLGLRHYGGMAYDIVNYAFKGAAIGNLIGAIAGTVVGILVSLLNIFMSKKKRIRKAQWLVQEKIDCARSGARKALQKERQTLFTPLRQQIDDAILSRVQTLDDALKHPLKMIEQQVALMKHIKDQLENMPYGTIQAIQC